MFRLKDFLILIGAIVAILVVAWYFGFIQKVGAVKPEPYKVICHHNPGNDVTLEFVNQQSYEGHLGTPHNDQVYDTDGPCETSPTPSEEPTVTPEVTPEVTPDPTATPTPIVVTNTVTTEKVVEKEVVREVQIPATSPNTGRAE